MMQEVLTDRENSLITRLCVWFYEAVILMGIVCIAIPLAILVIITSPEFPSDDR